MANTYNHPTPTGTWVQVNAWGSQVCQPDPAGELRPVLRPVLRSWGCCAHIPVCAYTKHQLVFVVEAQAIWDGASSLTGALTVIESSLWPPVGIQWGSTHKVYSLCMVHSRCSINVQSSQAPLRLALQI